MKNQNEIQNLENKIQSAVTYTIEGCQTVANVCKELYKLIEKDVYNSGNEWMLRGLYSDLCNGNFAEPFICETKKTTFLTVKNIYETKVLPRL